MRMGLVGRLAALTALILSIFSCKQGATGDFGGSELMASDGKPLKDDPTYGEWAFEKQSEKTVDDLEASGFFLAGGEHDFEVIEGDIVFDKKKGLNLGSAESNLWPNATVIYEFDPNFPDRVDVERAMRVWTQETGVQFRPRSNERGYVVIRREKVSENGVEKDSEGCWSNVGYTGGLQYINLGSGCLVFGTKLHEIGHTLGLNHEQSRKDRDSYVTLHLENLPDEDGRDEVSRRNLAAGKKKKNIDNFSMGSVDVGRYDYDSVMHYGRYAFSGNGQPTIEARNGQPIGQRQGLSPFDVQAVSQMYGTRGTGGSGSVIVPGQGGPDMTDPTGATTVYSRPGPTATNAFANVPAAPPIPTATTSVSTGCPGFGGYDWEEQYAKKADKCRDAKTYCTCWRTVANTCGLYLPNGSTNVAGAAFASGETNCKASCTQVAANGSTYMRNNCNQELVVINAVGRLEVWNYASTGRSATPVSD